MITIKASIIDDSITDAENVRKILLGLQINDCCITADIIQDIPSDLPASDLYLIDIEMPYKNGFQLADEINRKYPESSIAFVSQYEDLVYESQRYYSFFFVRKSHLELDLRDAVQKYMYLNRDRNRQLTLHSDGKIQKYPVMNILYIEVIRNTLILHTDDDDISFRQTLKFVSDELPDYLFARIHRSYLINLSRVKEYNSEMVILDNGTELPVSRRCRNKFLAKYNAYMIRRG